ncbi:hypothetical protein Tco_1108217 [Tanacetum coccineum]
MINILSSLTSFSKSNTRRRIVERVSDAGTAGVEVVASVVVGVGIGVNRYEVGKNGGMVVVGATVTISRIGLIIDGLGITKTGTVSTDKV